MSAVAIRGEVWPARAATGQHDGDIPRRTHGLVARRHQLRGVREPDHGGHPRQRLGRPPRPAAGAPQAPVERSDEQHADSQQVGDQRRAAVGQQRQRYAGNREHPEHDRKVDQRLDHEPDSHPACRVPRESVVGAAGDRAARRNPEPGTRPARSGCRTVRAPHRSPRR